MDLIALCLLNSSSFNLETKLVH